MGINELKELLNYCWMEELNSGIDEHGQFYYNYIINFDCGNYSATITFIDGYSYKETLNEEFKSIENAVKTCVKSLKGNLSNKLNVNADTNEMRRAFEKAGFDERFSREYIDGFEYNYRITLEHGEYEGQMFFDNDDSDYMWTHFFYGEIETVIEELEGLVESLNELEI